jgi:uncharacterized membrane protein YgcG
LNANVAAKDDRTVRIAPAQALEGAIPDLMAQRIIDEHIVPAFKRGDHADGLHSATQALMALIKGENLPKPVQRERNVMSWPVALIFVMVLLGVPIKIGLWAVGVAKRAGWILAGLLSAVYLYFPRQPNPHELLPFVLFIGFPALVVGSIAWAVWVAALVGAAHLAAGKQPMGRAT